MTESGAVAIVLVWVLLCVAIYMLPSIIALIKRNRRTKVILFNIFLGWTVVMWIISLVWACKREEKPAEQPMYQPYPPQQPVYQNPQYQAPQQPVYQDPQYQAPQQPVYQDPQYQAPQQPVYQDPQQYNNNN